MIYEDTGLGLSRLFHGSFDSVIEAGFPLQERRLESCTFFVFEPSYKQKKGLPCWMNTRLFNNV